LAPTPSPPDPAGPRHWLDDPQNVKRLWRGFLVVLVLIVLAEAPLHLHPTFAIEGVFGFSAWFGFLACAVMIAGAKALAVWLRRPDTYYEPRDD
jgi:hypothetical protein